ncbi:MAG: hypothetical protein JWL95_1936, partial [Gemmatimonadetes bacterium]|nr:hypothetical protein [Gemmatimonadota bacterium]
MKAFNARSLAAVVAMLGSVSACSGRTVSVGSPAASAPSTDNVRRIRSQGPPLGVQLWSFREQAKPDPV